MLFAVLHQPTCNVEAKMSHDNLLDPRHIIIWTFAFDFGQNKQSEKHGRQAQLTKVVCTCVLLCDILWPKVVLCSVTFWWQPFTCNCSTFSKCTVPTQAHPTMSCILLDLTFESWKLENLLLRSTYTASLWVWYLRIGYWEVHTRLQNY